VDVQVLEGRFVEVPTSEVTGVARRAFGEFVGPGGELASYAFGWTAGAEPHVARLSIGIGAGLGTRCIQTIDVFELREPILLVSNDADDGLWQLIGTTDADADSGKVGHLHHAVDEDPTLVDVLDLAPGHSATRTHVGGPWTRHPGDPA
jgi:hypothetical protein